jgi:hypothetical protein
MIGVVLKTDGIDVEGVKRHFPKARKRGHFLVGNKWHRSMMRGHFKMSAIQKYGYRKRSKKYMKKKQRLKHHQLPLVFSGVTRNRALLRNVRATSKLTRVILPVQALNFQGFRQELTAVTDGETGILEDTFVKSTETALKNLRAGKTITFK